MKHGNRMAGPALIIEPHQTIVVEPEWQAEINALGHVVLTRAIPKPRPCHPRPGCRSGNARSRSTTCSCRSPSRWA
ncbi:MAG: hypothetical protein R3D29_10585 [Nitratireductor sp.]